VARRRCSYVVRPVMYFFVEDHAYMAGVQDEEATFDSGPRQRGCDLHVAGHLPGQSSPEPTGSSQSRPARPAERQAEAGRKRRAEMGMKMEATA